MTAILLPDLAAGGLLGDSLALGLLYQVLPGYEVLPSTKWCYCLTLN